MVSGNAGHLHYAELLHRDILASLVHIGGRNQYNDVGGDHVKKRTMLAGLTGDYEIVEAVQPRFVTITDEDVLAAIEHDPRNCAIAESCRRVGALEAVIGANIAYVVDYSPFHRKNVAFKYGVNRGTRRAIDRFDMSGVMPNKPLRLSVLPPSERIEARRGKFKAKTKNDNPRKQVQMKRGPRHMELRNARDVIK